MLRRLRSIATRVGRKYGVRDAIARPAIRRLASMKFIRSAELRENPKFLTFLNYGMRFDHATAATAVEWLIECRTNWAGRQEESRWQSYSQEAKFGWIHEMLFSIVSDAAAKITPDGPWYLGLSGGLDSRSLLYALNAGGRAVQTYTFGQPGNRDYDLIAELGRRTGHESIMFDTNRLDWRLDDFVVADFFQDLPISPRVVAHCEILRRVPRRVEWHGYFNDRLIGRYFQVQPSETWEEAVEGFSRTSDNFRFQRFIPPAVARSALPVRPIVSQRALSLDLQLAHGYKSAQRLRPCDGPGVTFIVPYRDARWVGFWLNRDASERVGEKLFIAAMRSLNAPDFFDLPRGDMPAKADLRKNQLRLLYGERHKELALTPVSIGNEKIVHPTDPTMHFCLVSCYANNARFRSFVEQAVQGLQDQAIFEAAFVRSVKDSFLAGDREGARMMEGLVSTYVQYRCGRFAA